MRDRLKLIFWLVILSLAISIIDFVGSAIGGIPVIGGFLLGLSNTALESIQSIVNVLVLILIGRYMK